MYTFLGNFSLVSIDYLCCISEMAFSISGFAFAILFASAGAQQAAAVPWSSLSQTAPKQYLGKATRTSLPDTLPSGTTFLVQLIDSISAKKARVGKKFKANIVGTIPGTEPFIIKDFSRVSGHVTKVQKRDKNHLESHLQVMIDKIKFKHGKEAVFKGIVTSVAIRNETATMRELDPQLGYYVDVRAPDDSGDISSFVNYSFPESKDGTGVIVSSTTQNVYLSWHTVLTIKVK